VYTVCTRPWAAVYRLRTAALGCVQTVYSAVHGPCTWSVRVPNTAVYAAGTWQNTAGYAACTRPCTYRIHGRARAVYRVHGGLHRRLYGSCARPCTYHVHGRAWSVHDPNTACTRSCTLYTAVFAGRVLLMDTAVFTARVRGRIPCTCQCLWPVYTAVHGRVQTAYGPCTWSVHDPNGAAAPTRPCLQPVPCTLSFKACTGHVHHDSVHSRHRKS